jgi:hypothetical protein
MPIHRIVVGTVIVFSKVGIRDLPTEFLNIIHLSYSKDTGSEFSYWMLIFIYQRYSLSGCFSGFLFFHQVAR